VIGQLALEVGKLGADYFQQLAARFRGQLPQVTLIDDEADHANSTPVRCHGSRRLAI
jgi:uncharacterized protein YnzC (UPF0291/DUF896 family)